jgi:transposase
MPTSVTTRLNHDNGAGRSLNVRMEPMTRRSTFSYSPELRERAVRLLLDHATDHPSQWTAIRLVGGKLGGRVDALWRWFRQSARDAGLGGDSPADERR